MSSQSTGSCTRGIRGMTKCPDVINVLTHILTHLDPIVDQYLFKQQEQQSELDDRSDIAKAFDTICRSMWSDDGDSRRELIDISPLCALFQSEEFVATLDFVEAYHLLLDGCGKKFDFCNGVTSNCIKSSDYCPMCGHKTETERRENFYSMKVSSNQWKEFENSGILNLREVENIDGVHCDMCSFTLPSVDLSHSVSVAPQMLALQLDRFYFSFETFQNMKKKDFYKVYLNQQLKLLMGDNSVVAYDLVAVADHYGQETSGAYAGYFLNPTNRRWYKTTGFSAEVPFLVEDLSSINSVSNYVYFFQKAVEKKTSWQPLLSQSASDISFSFTADSESN